MSLQGTMQNTGFYDPKVMKDKIGVSSLKIMDGEDLSKKKKITASFIINRLKPTVTENISSLYSKKNGLSSK